MAWVPGVPVPWVPCVPWLLLCLLLSAASAAAHPVPFSYLDLHVDASAAQPVTGALTLHVFDAAHELAIDPPERLLAPEVASANAAALEDVLARRLSVEADGRGLAIAWGPIEVLADKQSLRLPFGVRPGSDPLAG